MEKDQVMDEYKQNSILKEAIYRTGNVKFQIFYPAKSTINKIDYLLSQYFNLNTEELDFIINYDIKYRMGNDNQKGVLTDEDISVNLLLYP